MDAATMRTYFRELYNLSSHTNDGKEDDEIDIYLNLAQNKFVDKNVLLKDGLVTISEQALDNLRTLFVTGSSLTLTASSEITNANTAPYPADMRYKVALRCNITRTDVESGAFWYIAKPIRPTDVWKYSYNPKNNPNIPIPLFTTLDDDKLLILFDKYYTTLTSSKINDVKLDYIKEPVLIASGTDCELPANTHYEIVEDAVRIALKSSSVEPADKVTLDLNEARQ